MGVGESIPIGTYSSRGVLEEDEGWSVMDPPDDPLPKRSCSTIYPKPSGSSTSIVLALVALGGCGGVFNFRFLDF
ncbi:hypothetical protein Csa_018910, partial [Cucumis sativus]